MTRSATRGQIKGLTAALRAIPLQAAFLCLKRAAGTVDRGLVQGGPGGGRWAGPCGRTGRTWPVCGYGSRGGGAGGPADRLRTFVAWLRMEAGQRGAGPCPQEGWRMRRRQPPLGRRLAGRGWVYPHYPQVIHRLAHKTMHKGQKAPSRGLPRRTCHPPVKSP